MLYIRRSNSALYIRGTRTRWAESRGQLLFLLHNPIRGTHALLHSRIISITPRCAVRFTKITPLLSCAAIGSTDVGTPQNMARTRLLKTTRDWPRQRPTRRYKYSSTITRFYARIQVQFLFLPRICFLLFHALYSSLIFIPCRVAFVASLRQDNFFSAEMLIVRSRTFIPRIIDNVQTCSASRTQDVLGGARVGRVFQ